MAKVIVWSSLKSHTGGESNLEIEAVNVKDLLARLGETYPGLQPQLKRASRSRSMASSSATAG